jgi:hypothetical protein
LSITNWNDIGAFVFRSLYFGYETGHVSQFQTQGVITCIPKENKDRFDIMLEEKIIIYT